MDLPAAFQARARADEDMLEVVMRDVYTEFLREEAPFTAIDGGAHKGMHTWPLARLRNCQMIYAVEANAGLAEFLRKQIEREFGLLYRLGLRKAAHVNVVMAALQEDAARRTTSFMLSSSHAGRSGISSIFAGDPDVSFVETTVLATTIDQLAAQRHYPIKFVKLDLEGGEWNAVRGAADIMARDRPVFAMEHSLRSPEINGYDKGQYLALFEQRGYQLLTFAGERLDADNMFYLWYVWAAPKEVASRLSASLKRHAARRV